MHSHDNTPTPPSTSDKLVMNRRHFLGLTATTGVALATSTLTGCSSLPSYQESANIVIIGSGLAGLAVANRLSKQLPNAKLTIIDQKKEHNYQPGYTLLATGVWDDTNKVISNNADLMPDNIEWIEEFAGEFKPENNQVITESGKTVSYDYLVIATGLRLGYEKIEGLTVDDLGKNGIGSVYASPDIAKQTWQQMDEFRKTGGKALMTLANTDMKCAGAPLKMTFLLHDRLTQSGTRANSDIQFFSPKKTSVFSVPVVNENVLKRWAEFEHPINVNFERVLTKVDTANKLAYFSKPDGSLHEEKYDFLHVVPPMFAVDSILKTPSLINEKGWLDVDKYTLRHNRYPNIFGAGDINGTPKGKTAATVKKSAPVVVNNLIEVIQGKEPTNSFDGYTSCPLLVKEGQAMLVEFDYENNLTPSVPLIDPLQAGYFAWFLEDMMLQPAYMAVAKGQV